MAGRRPRPHRIRRPQINERTLHEGLILRKHPIDPGPIALELYRLLCISATDDRIVEFALRSNSIDELRHTYRDTEVTRILVSSSVMLRVWMDQEHPKNHPRAFDDSKSDCGRLFAEWPRKKSQVLTLREACNKIIHAEQVYPDIVGFPDRGDERYYIRPNRALYGTLRGKQWRAELSIVSFVTWGTVLLQWWR
jgi:hypothetical protein